MSIPPWTRSAHALMEEISQKQITPTKAKQRAQKIQSDDPETSSKLDLFRQALDAYCAEPSQKNLAATVKVVMTFPGFRELILEKASALGFCQRPTNGSAASP